MLQRDPDYYRAANSLALVYAKQGTLLHSRWEALTQDPPARFGGKEREAFVAAGLDEFGHSAPQRLAAVRDAKWDKAEELLQQSLQLRPRSAEVHTNLGSLEYAKGNLRTAEHYYARAVLLDPVFANARFGLGMALERQGRFAEAAGQYTVALQLDPAHRQAWKRLANTYQALGQVADAQHTRVRYEI
jgi:adenylate cyclase